MKWLKTKKAETLLTFGVGVLGLVALVAAVMLTVSRNSASEPDPQARDKVVDATLSPPSNVKPLAIGSVAKLGSDYSVSVTDVTMYSDKTDQYIVATVKAKYNGKGKGDPTNDLNAAYSTSNSKKSTASIESACAAEFGHPDLSLLNVEAPLAGGASKSYVVCIDIPSKKIDTGMVSIAASAGGNRAFWTTKGAPSKVAPTPAPTVVAQGPVVNKAKTAKSLKDLEKQLKKAKKARKILDKQIDFYEDAPDHKKKKLKKMKKALDQTDDIIDQMEKIKDQLEAAS